MQLAQLRHFSGLAQAGSFSKAARGLFITQPALSRSIRALEDELGFALFDRVGRRIELTPFGRDVLERARRLLDDARNIAELGAGLRDGRAGRLGVGLGSGPAAFLTRPLLASFASRQRGERLVLARVGAALLLQRLHHRTLEAWVVEWLSVPASSDLHIDMPTSMRGAFLCRPGHALSRQRRVRFEQLLEYPLACTPLSDEIARTLVLRYGPAAHPGRLVTLRGDDLHSLVDVTQSSDAILLAVRAVAPGLHELPLDPPVEASARFGLITLARRAEAPAMSLLRQALLEHLHD
jgi:DNA-binding transcriptional LysR family regulator